MNSAEKIPSREEAEAILAAALKKNPRKWGAHSRYAAVSAEAIGRAAGLDPDRCYVSGLLHDIGRFKGKVQLAHIYHGQYLIIINKGKTRMEGKADLVFHDRISEILGHL